MTKRAVVLLCVTVVLAGTFLWIDPLGWFSSQPIQGMAQMRVPGGRVNPKQRTFPIVFGFDRAYDFTMIKVTPVPAEGSTEEPLPVWHLVVDDAKPDPDKPQPKKQTLQAFAYGQRIRGLKPALPNARPEPLEPDKPYRLYVEAGDRRGQLDFHTKLLPGRQ